MLISGKKFRVLRDIKNKYSNSCVVRRNISERNKKPQPFTLNGRSLSVFKNKKNKKNKKISK